jgi:hypothetical protein
MEAELDNRAAVIAIRRKVGIVILLIMHRCQGKADKPPARLTTGPVRGQRRNQTSNELAAERFADIADVYYLLRQSKSPGEVDFLAQMCAMWLLGEGQCCQALADVAWQVLALDAKDLDSLILGKVLADRRPGDVSLSTHGAHCRRSYLLGQLHDLHGIVATAILQIIRREGRRADENQHREHDQLSFRMPH